MKKTSMVILWFLFKQKKVLNMKHEHADNKQLESETPVYACLSAPLWCVMMFCFCIKNDHLKQFHLKASLTTRLEEQVT